MSFQAPNLVSGKRLSLGGGIIYLSPSPITTKTSVATEYFRNLGAVEKGNQSTFEYNMEKLEWKSGTPSKTVYEAIINETINFNAPLSELSPLVMGMLFNSDMAVTLAGGTSTVEASPAPTTKTFTVASAIDFVEGDYIEIDLGTGGTADLHYRMIESISGAAITLDEALKEAPATGDTVKEVSVMDFDFGASTVPKYFGFKFEKKLMKHLLTIVLYKVSVAGQVSLSFQDDAPNTYPISVASISDPDVESGKPGFARLTKLT
jgi:hypothetical protein